jgi:hypothetical protein
MKGRCLQLTKVIAIDSEDKDVILSPKAHSVIVLVILVISRRDYKGGDERDKLLREVFI